MYTRLTALAPNIDSLWAVVTSANRALCRESSLMLTVSHRLSPKLDRDGLRTTRTYDYAKERAPLVQNRRSCL